MAQECGAAEGLELGPSDGEGHLIRDLGILGEAGNVRKTKQRNARLRIPCRLRLQAETLEQVSRSQITGREQNSKRRVQNLRIRKQV